MGVFVRDNLLYIKRPRLLAWLTKLCAGCAGVSLFVFLLVGSLLVPVYALAEDSNQQSGYEIKATYLYNITKFVRWPADQSLDQDASPSHVCLLGLNEFKDAFHAATIKLADNHNFLIRTVKADTGYNDCHVLFIGQSEISQLSKVLQSVAILPILTVSDIEGFAIGGGCLELAIIDNKVVFSVNMHAANNAQLKFSAQLLEMAKTVIGK